jgi:hypothetical protein
MLIKESIKFNDGHAFTLHDAEIMSVVKSSAKNLMLQTPRNEIAIIAKCIKKVQSCGKGMVHWFLILLILRSAIKG